MLFLLAFFFWGFPLSHVVLNFISLHPGVPRCRVYMGKICPGDVYRDLGCFNLDPGTPGRPGLHINATAKITVNYLQAGTPGSYKQALTWINFVLFYIRDRSLMWRGWFDCDNHVSTEFRRNWSFSMKCYFFKIKLRYLSFNIALWNTKLCKLALWNTKLCPNFIGCANNHKCCHLWQNFPLVCPNFPLVCPNLPGF